MSSCAYGEMMCNPMIMAVGGFLVQGAQAVVGFMGEQQAYSQAEAHRQQNIKNANAAALDQYNQTLTRIRQEGDAVGIQKSEAVRDARAARATASVAAGESGVSGLSVDNLIADIYGREGTYLDQLSEQNDWTSNQLYQDMRGIRAAAIDRGNSIPEPVKPNFLGAGLRIMGAGLGAYGQYNKWTT